MPTPSERFDLLIIGGGLAGLMAAERAESAGARVALIDCGVPGTSGQLGGFAPFSGAKFSLFPAGSGLAALTGGETGLVEVYRNICEEFYRLGFAQFRVGHRELVGLESSVGTELAYRRYHSVLLSPVEMNALLAALASRLRSVRVIRSTVTRLRTSLNSGFLASVAGTGEVYAKRIIMAAGRLGADLLTSAGVPETAGKGIDVGVRLGFSDGTPLAKLRELGPDAKFMARGVRTFCLNSPGRIFHYPGLGLQIPGGVVADSQWAESNVGILCRLADKQAFLRTLASHVPEGGHVPLRLRGRGTALGWTKPSVTLVGEHVVARIDEFIEELVNSGLVCLPNRYDVHYPLLDWYWPVFSLPGRLETGATGIFAVGDASGHARGLMQAAVMGTLAVEESLP